MTLDEQVSSLELSKQLKELGFKQESLFYYILYSEWKICLNGKYSQTYYRDCISTFTASELMHMLPDRIDTKTNEPFNHFRFNLQRGIVVPEQKPVSVFFVNYYCDTVDANSIGLCGAKLLSPNIYDESLANTLAKVLIALIEKEYVVL